MSIGGVAIVYSVVLVCAAAILWFVRHHDKD